MERAVRLSEEAYEHLEAYKHPGESFSQAIQRLLDAQPKDPLGFPDRVPKSPVSGQEHLRRIEADRESTRREA